MQRRRGGPGRAARERRRPGARPGLRPGALVAELLQDAAFTEIVGVDVSAARADLAARRLQLDRMPDGQRGRLRLFQSSLTYPDERLRGYDAAVLMEVIEHVDPPRLPALETRCSATPGRGPWS